MSASEKNKLQAVKGMSDRFEDELVTWRFIEAKAAEIFGFYGYEEIRTPILEDINVFVRGVGEHTDVVEKEMYALEDRDGKMLCLRPEGTASVVRALVENNKLAQEADVKYYYIGPMFRRERPQRGRLRQFHQLSVESFGIAEPTADIETLTLLRHFFELLGLSDLRLLINTLGEPEERKNYVDELRKYFDALSDQLCGDCKRRLEENTLRILDCKVPGCMALVEKAPAILEFLTDESKTHFDTVKKGLTANGVQFEVAPRLVRGLDYYTRTVFELTASSGLGAQNTVAAGGRYDRLVQELGGPSVPAFGFSAGMERIVLLLEEKGAMIDKKRPDLALIYADDAGKAKCFALANDLRRLDLYVELDLKSRSVKSQMRRADRLKAKAVMVLGGREVEEQKALIKMLDSGESFSESLSALSITRRLCHTK